MFWASGHEQPNFNLFIYIRYAAPPYSARISAIYDSFAKFGWVSLPCATPGNEAKRSYFKLFVDQSS